MPRKLYHFTPRKNAGSITTHGLLVRYHQSATPAIWLCGFRLQSWTLAHIRAKFEIPREQIVCYEVQVPSNWLFKASKGLWLCYHDLQPSRLRMVTT